MLTPITCLNEIISVVPGNPRQFQINEDELMGIDPDKAIAARTKRLSKAWITTVGIFLLAASSTAQTAILQFVLKQNNN